MVSLPAGAECANAWRLRPNSRRSTRKSPSSSQRKNRKQISLNLRDAEERANPGQDRGEEGRGSDFRRASRTARSSPRPAIQQRNPADRHGLRATGACYDDRRQLMPAIEVRELSKTYRVYRKREGLVASIGGLFRREYQSVIAVDHVTFSVEAGEIVAFLGPNGAGKTTTLKLLSGLIFPTAGEARVLSYVPWKRDNAFRRRFSLVMGQKNQLWWDLPAQESFRLHREIYRIDADRLPAAARRADGPARSAAARRPAGARAVAGRADADGADRRPAPRTRGALAGRADDRPRRRLAAPRAGLSRVLSGRAEDHGAA